MQQKMAEQLLADIHIAIKNRFREKTDIDKKFFDLLSDVYAIGKAGGVDISKIYEIIKQDTKEKYSMQKEINHGEEASEKT